VGDPNEQRSHSHHSHPCDHTNKQLKGSHRIFGDAVSSRAADVIVVICAGCADQNKKPNKDRDKTCGPHNDFLSLYIFLSGLFHKKATEVLKKIDWERIVLNEEIMDLLSMLALTAHGASLTIAGESF
jgi:hypothetical protein